MNVRRLVLLLLLITLCGTVPGGLAANTITADPSTISLTPSSTETALILVDNLPYGLSGYHVRVSLADPSLGAIVNVQYPPWAVLNNTTGLGSGTVTISAVDLSDQVKAGSASVELARITFQGKNTGVTSVSLAPLKLDGDGEGGVDLGQVHVVTTQTATSSGAQIVATPRGSTYSGGGTGGGSAAAYSGSGSTAGGGVPTTPGVQRSETTVAMANSGNGAIMSVTTPGYEARSIPATQQVVSTAEKVPATPVDSRGIPGWIVGGAAIIAVIAAAGLLYLAYTRKI